MPVSLNSMEDDQLPPSKQNTTSTSRQKVKTTNNMVDEALFRLHSVKGITLKQIYNYILSTYALDTITSKRVLLIKKHLNELRETEDIKNKTGKGFSGHLKLVDKEKFLKKLKANDKQRPRARKTKKAVDIGGMKTAMNITQDKSKPIKTKSYKESVKRKIQRPPIGTQEHLPVVPRQTTPVRENDLNQIFGTSMFDTPMVVSSTHHSTPRVESNIVPQAPDIRSKASRKRVLHPPNDEVGGTPRSSFPEKKRKIQKHVK